jgi:hypothetical protein
MKLSTNGCDDLSSCVRKLKQNPCNKKIKKYFHKEFSKRGLFNATFNNISVISWWSALLVEESGVPGENY